MVDGCLGRSEDANRPSSNPRRCWRRRRKLIRFILEHDGTFGSLSWYEALAFGGK
jgi:hypothetical protein